MCYVSPVLTSWLVVQQLFSVFFMLACSEFAKAMQDPNLMLF